MRRLFSVISFPLLLLVTSDCANAQNNTAAIQPPSGGEGGNQLIDKIVAVVGGKMILQSEVKERIAEYQQEKMADSNNKCKVLEDLLYEKLLLLGAEKDSTIIISDEQVNQEFDKRMNYYLTEFGSKEEFEKKMEKTVDQFKEELKPDIKDLLMAQQERGKIIDNLQVSPEEVRKYFESIPADSIPQIDAQIELAQITLMPIITDEEKSIAKEKIDELRERVLKGEDMATLAVMYTADPGSIKTGGLYKNIKRGEFVPEFEKVAFNLKDSEISQVFETPYGYHFIQMVHRHGDLVDLRHILITPAVSDKDMGQCMERLDTIYSLIKRDSIKFSDAAAEYSDDKNTKFNGGVLINPQTGLSKWDMNMLGQLEMSDMMDKNIGDITQPELFNTPEGKRGYRIVMLKNRTKPHKANLKDDYQQIQAAALARKQLKVITDWIGRKIKEGLYVHIDKEYTTCNFHNKWIAKP